MDANTLSRWRHGFEPRRDHNCRQAGANNRSAVVDAASPFAHLFRENPLVAEPARPPAPGSGSRPSRVWIVIAATAVLAALLGMFVGSTVLTGDPPRAPLEQEPSPAPAARILSDPECLDALTKAEDAFALYEYWARVQVIECGTSPACTDSIRQDTSRAEAAFRKAAQACREAAS